MANNNNEVPTYGDLIEKKVAEAVSTYNLMKRSPIKDMNGDPKGWAMHNLKMDLFVIEEAIKQAEQIIDAMEASKPKQL